MWPMPPSCRPIWRVCSRTPADRGSSASGAAARARRFRWEDTAGKALDALTRPPARPRPVRGRAPRRRIAFFSPLPPLRSAVSDYSARLLDELNRRYAVDVYHDAGSVPHIGLTSPEFGCYDYRLFERNAGVLGYHALVYQMGDSPYHGYIYDTLLRHPGVVTLHDLDLAGFQLWYATGPGWTAPPTCGGVRDVLRSGGRGGLERPGRPRRCAGGDARACLRRGYHLNGRIFDRATAVIVHSPWCVEQIRKRFPAHLGKMSVVPIGTTAPDPSPEQRKAIRARFEVPPEALVIAGLGPPHVPGRTIETMAAFVPLAHAIPEALLVFVGGEHDSVEARQAVADLGLPHRVRFLGHDPDDLADLAAIADIGVYLRRPPTSGKTSAPLMDLLRLGVATIVSDVGWFSDYPDSVVRQYRREADGIAGLTQALSELAEDRPRREALAARRGNTSGGSRRGRARPTPIRRSSSGPSPDGTGSWPTAPTPLRPRIVTSPVWLQAAS